MTVFILAVDTITPPRYTHDTRHTTRYTGSNNTSHRYPYNIVTYSSTAKYRRHHHDDTMMNTMLHGDKPIGKKQNAAACAVVGRTPSPYRPRITAHLNNATTANRAVVRADGLVRVALAAEATRVRHQRPTNSFHLGSRRLHPTQGEGHAKHNNSMIGTVVQYNYS